MSNTLNQGWEFEETSHAFQVLLINIFNCWNVLHYLKWNMSHSISVLKGTTLVSLKLKSMVRSRYMVCFRKWRCKIEMECRERESFLVFRLDNPIRLEKCVINECCQFLIAKANECCCPEQERMRNQLK